MIDATATIDTANDEIQGSPMTPRVRAEATLRATTIESVLKDLEQERQAAERFIKKARRYLEAA